MEFFSILLAGLFSSLSPVGWIVDQRLEAVFRSRVATVDTLAVRVDNRPSYQLLQGQIQQIRLGSEGVTLKNNLRLQSLSVETDSIDLNLKRFRQGEFSSLSEVQQGLFKPLNVAIQMSFKEEDLNDFLASPEVKANLEGIMQRIVNQLPSGRNQRYELLSTELQFLAVDRFSLHLKLRVSRRQREEFQEFNLRIESGLDTPQGKQITLVDPVFTLDGEPLPPRLVTIASQRLSSRLDLGALEQQNIIARLLQLNIEEDEVKLAAFVQIPNVADRE